MEFKRSRVWGLESEWERVMGARIFCVMTRDEIKKRKTKGALGLLMGAKEEET